MNTSKKDKRTKDQLLLLLDNALVQEEKLSEQIADLQAQVEELRKRNENPGAGQLEEALPSTKIPFRLDFYRISHDGPLKGVLEHLPSRQKKTFEGDGHAIIQAFVGQFVQEEKNEADRAPVLAETRPSTRKITTIKAAPEPVAPHLRLAKRVEQDFYRQFPELQTDQSN